ncbi:MAG: SUMF1/EgtB/PvdO family nonheme iron enzyme [Gammaproteobacteria bacterium]|nr:SUMF1/EgtB/PvdO family nonheme iron enzyme [Gammaproteobacteria bacterium]
MTDKNYIAPDQIESKVAKNTSLDAQSFEVPTNEVESIAFKLTFAHVGLIIAGLLCLVFIVFISVANSVQIFAVTPNLNKPDELLLQDAEIQIHSKIKLPLGNRTLVLPGKHKVSVIAEGFSRVDQTLSISGDRHQQFELVINRLPGLLKLMVADEVKGRVRLEGEQTLEHKLSEELIEVPAGRYDVIIDADLYRPYSTSMLIKGKGEQQVLEASLDPAWAEYTLATTPANAMIFVDDEQKGASPAVVKIEEGTRRLRIVAEGYKPYQREISVVAQQPVQVPVIDLEPADGRLELHSNPSGAAVILNDKFKGVTPLSLVVAPDQQQRLQVYKAGYKLDERSFALKPDENQSKTLDLALDAIPVRVSVSPPDAVVYVDGKRLGPGTQTVNLSSLPHRVSVRKPGYVTQNNDIVPTRSSSQLLSFRLLTEEQHYWAQIPAAYTNRAGHEMKLFKQLGPVKLGSPRTEDGRRANEKVYQAELTRPFYVAVYETTNKQFRRFKASHNAGNYKGKSLDANKAPAVNLSWQQAAQYCNWLSKIEGLDPFYQTKAGFVSGVNADANGYRLLSEAEWSWLARSKGKETLVYPWGRQKNVPTGSKIENYADVKAQDLITFTLQGYDDGFKGPAPVGRFPPNHRGLYDLTGNAAEWMHDWYSSKGSSELTKSGKILNPLGPENGEFHVVRGASWARGYLPQLRLAYRDYGAKGTHDIGFRVARYAGLNKSKNTTVAKQ